MVPEVSESPGALTVEALGSRPWSPRSHTVGGMATWLLLLAEVILEHPGTWSTTPPFNKSL